MNRPENDVSRVNSLYDGSPRRHGADRESPPANLVEFATTASPTGKTLYDFEDIESYNPDGTYFGDNCPTTTATYDADGACRASKPNWPLEWQATHTEGVDWYQLQPRRTLKRKRQPEALRRGGCGRDWPVGPSRHVGHEW